MDRQHFIRLLHKYLAGQTTIKEKKFLETYYDLFQNDPDVLSTIDIKEKEALKNSLKNAIWAHLLKDEKQIQKIKVLSPWLKMAAAAILIMALISSLFYIIGGSSIKQQDLTKHIIVPHNENRVISLSDGSTIILSPGSMLNYPPSFDGMKKREVFLDGQAFFDIHHNPSIPFIVHTGNLETMVLGTAFNIKAISGEAEITVTVKRGKVKVTDKEKISDIITPNQQIIYNKERVSSDTKTIDSESYLDWKAADLLFDNLTIAEASQLLEERYKVNITITDLSVSTQRFTASFPKNETLEQALKSICVFNELTYDYNKERSSVIISNK